jgi:hypothetical protein
MEKTLQRYFLFFIKTKADDMRTVIAGFNRIARLHDAPYCVDFLINPSDHNIKIRSV